MPHISATQVLDELIAEMGEGSGPCERVVDEYFGSIAQERSGSVVYPALFGDLHDRAEEAVHELRRTWGPTADPHWVDSILPGRGRQPDEVEFDCYFALFKRKGVWGYVRMRAPETDTPENGYLRLILGVVRDKQPDNARQQYP
jgi:hypothetical protein